jgi:hypothetical protein
MIQKLFRGLEEFELGGVEIWIPRNEMVEEIGFDRMADFLHILIVGFAEVFNILLWCQLGNISDNCTFCCFLN